MINLSTKKRGPNPSQKNKPQFKKDPMEFDAREEKVKVGKIWDGMGRVLSVGWVIRGTLAWDGLFVGP